MGKIECYGCGRRCAIEPRWSDDLTGFHCPRDGKTYTPQEIAAINEHVARSPVGLLMDAPYIMHDSRIEGNEERTEGKGKRGARSEESFRSSAKDSRTPTAPPQLSQATPPAKSGNGMTEAAK